MPPESLRRLWTMIAHYHGQIWNASEVSRSLGVAHTTVQRHLDILARPRERAPLRAPVPAAALLGRRMQVSLASRGLIARHDSDQGR